MAFSKRRHFLFTVLFALGSFLIPAIAKADVAQGVPSHIAKKGELAVGLEGTYPPFNYQDENGQLVGFEVDFTNELAKRLGLKAKFYPTKWDQYLVSADERANNILDIINNNQKYNIESGQFVEIRSLL